MSGRLAMCAIALFASIAVATVDGPDQADVQKILQQADSATRNVRAVEYDVEYYATGEYAERVPKVHARVLARQGRRGFFSNPLAGAEEKTPDAFRFAGTVDAPEGVRRSFDVSTDGRQVVSIETESRSYVFGNEDASPLITQVKPLFMLEFFHPTPFHDEINGKTLRYEGVQKIGDVDCDVIYVGYQRDYLDARWYFGCEDHLPRRVDRVRFRGTAPIGELVLEIHDLNTTPSFDADAFAPPPPPGFEQRSFTAGKRRLKRGDAAPDFTLKSPDGTTVQLSALRGNVVVLDFWSTWCLPCKLSMPQLQSLHEKYANQPVKVFGLNCWDKDGDPARLMADMKYSYGLLLKADDVAREYGVESIPAVFVVDAEGRVCFTQSGVVPSLERKIDRAIRRALQSVEKDDE
ncbi:MAG: TlpA family protein disulfide reductase [Phycisphaerales bacterium]|nr:TlpA family protein disulfide reductase [Phycisphaerales bacterium]MCB9864024.1 TlpA family protein disulfide reductase [Phycisphaerales bacterium]